MKNYSTSIMAAATQTNKSENQDSFSTATGATYKLLAIADGLGSVNNAKLSSEKVIEFFKNHFEKNAINGSSNSQYGDLFHQTKQSVRQYAVEKYGDDWKSSENFLATTLISLCENENEIQISYTGNGAAWHIRSNFNSFPEYRFFPWNAINLLNPHTIDENGKEALYRFISSSDDFSECIPSVINLQKDKIIGDIIVIVTDGIYSADQVRAGKNDKGVWVKYEESMMKLFKSLNDFFKNTSHYDNESLHKKIAEYLDKLKPQLEDDATIAVLVTETAMNYQYKLMTEKNENRQNN